MSHNGPHDTTDATRKSGDPWRKYASHRSVSLSTNTRRLERRIEALRALESFLHVFGPPRHGDVAKRPEREMRSQSNREENQNNGG